jgi:adenine-specific DNA-methyltransferase
MELPKMKLTSASGSEINLEALYQICPSCFTEVKDEKTGELTHKINFSTLRELLGDNAFEGADEEYGFNWVGKNAARREAARVITKTLRPCPEESVDWENTQNLYIEGDNLEVLKLLQKSYLGKIKMIYIDPPYNTGNDFVYRDDFAMSADEYDTELGNVDELGNRFRRNTDANGRFHSDWCSMMYTRLMVARSLLREDGVIFISIDDHEVDNLKKICSQIFGEANFVGCAGRITKKSNNKGDFWAPNFDYLLTYTKNREVAQEFTGGANESSYNLIEENGPRKGERYQLVRLFMSSIQNRNPEQRFWIDCPDGSKIIPPGTTFPPERPNLGDGIWRWSRSTFEANRDKIVIKKVRSSNLLNERHEQAEWNVFTKTYLNDVIEKASAKPNNFIEGHINQIASHELNALGIPFDYAKPTTLLKYLMKISQVDDNDIVLDFFSGSGSSAHAALSYNCEETKTAKFVMVQWPEEIDDKNPAKKAGYKNICEIGKERIRRAGKKIKEEGGLQAQNLDIGFRVFKCEDSFMNDVYFSPAELKQEDLFSQVENIKDGTSDLSMLFGCMLDWGVQLSLPLSDYTVSGKRVYNVNDGDLVACFAEDVNEDVISAIAELSPLRVVFRDSCFKEAAFKMNLFELFKQKCGWSEEQVKSRVHVI